ncbi:MAG: hypothetical protein PHS41_11400 [Victivallaceae bacterium]|nr:hypothetical protein [Victivallaceae bacterium]
MKKILLAGGGLAILSMLCGCQSVTKVEFYEPTTDNAEYSVKTTENVQGHGPVKIIEGKSGVPDFSDNKTFRFNLNILGL